MGMPINGFSKLNFDAERPTPFIVCLARSAKLPEGLYILPMFFLYFFIFFIFFF